jgi:hypothetical protein
MVGMPVWAATLSHPADAQFPSQWLAHDLQRPRPPVVAPGPLQLPARPPSDALLLFDGQNLAEWRSEEHGPARWEVREGAMVSVPGSGYIYSRRVFGDVQLHVEWASPTPARGHGQERGNSGVFLMSKYEIQVLDSYQDETYADGQAAAVYGQYPPLVNACLPPGEWQAYDIVFRRPRFRRDGALESPARVTIQIWDEAGRFVIRFDHADIQAAPPDGLWIYNHALADGVYRVRVEIEDHLAYDAFIPLGPALF